MAQATTHIRPFQIPERRRTDWRWAWRMHPSMIVLFWTGLPMSSATFVRMWHHNCTMTRSLFFHVLLP